jgi:hypothetical protein
MEVFAIRPASLLQAFLASEYLLAIFDFRCVRDVMGFDLIFIPSNPARASAASLPRAPE